MGVKKKIRIKNEEGAFSGYRFLLMSHEQRIGAVYVHDAVRNPHSRRLGTEYNYLDTYIRMDDQRLRPSYSPRCMSKEMVSVLWR